MGRRETAGGFDAQFRRIFEARFASLARYLDRLSGDPALAADLAQDTFVRLYRRGSLPDDPPAWLYSVANNLLRNEMAKRARRNRLLWATRAVVPRNPHAAPDETLETKAEAARVRAALDALPLRERQLLLLSAEGYRYAEIAGILGVAAGSVGTLLRRARAEFHSLVGEPS